MTSVLICVVAENPGVTKVPTEDLKAITACVRSEAESQFNGMGTSWRITTVAEETGDWRDFAHRFQFCVSDMTKISRTSAIDRHKGVVHVYHDGLGWKVAQGELYLSTYGQWQTYGEIIAKMPDDEPHAWETFEQAFAALWKAVGGSLSKP